MTPERKAELDALCLTFRRDVLTTMHAIQTGHPGGSLSVCEILTALYFEKARDHFDRVVLSKGHAAPMLYRILAEKGVFPLCEMQSLRQIDSLLQGHPSSRIPGVEVTSGPLGCAYAVALGLMLADRMDGKDNAVYAVLGDGELNEGVVWETCLNAAKTKADRLITIVDLNGVQLDGPSEEIMPMGDVAAKFAAFGYHTLTAENGHDVAQLCDAIDEAKTVKKRPTVILAKTIKGKGVPFMEGQSAWHGKALSDNDYRLAMEALGGCSHG